MGILDMFSVSNVLYFPGDVTFYRSREIYELYLKIFAKLGINVRTIEKKTSCGLFALELGYEDEARKIARRNFEIFKEEDINEIITSSPECYKSFLENYPDFLPDWNLKIKNLWSILVEKIENKSRLVKYNAMERVTFHDNCYLGRYCNIYESPRKLLELIGYEVVEMDNSREGSFCCGSCGGLEISNQKLASSIAKERLLQAKRIGVKKMIVTSVENYLLLSKFSNDVGVEVLELSEVLALALGIKSISINKNDYEVEEVVEDEDKLLLADPKTSEGPIDE